MKALSIHQPWAWAIAKGLKDIENRTWRTHYRGPLLIHATGDKPEQSDCALVARQCRRRGEPVPDFDQLPRGGIVGVCELVNCVTEHNSEWFGGPYGFVLQRAREIPFKKIAGQQRIWNCRRPKGI
jgi:hypothetical protein